jgi:hypothetical protein
MPLNKESILALTNNGYHVFRHFLGPKFAKPGKAFKSPFYDDRKASCYVYLDKSTRTYRYKDFGEASHQGDCFFFVGMLYGLSCDDRDNFRSILGIINSALGLNLEEIHQKTEAIIRNSAGKVVRANQIPSIHEGFETAMAKMPIIEKPFSEREMSFWGQYGVTRKILERYGVISVERFHGVGKEGKEYTLRSTDAEPIFGYKGDRYTKLYCPFSTLRFLFAGERTETYLFGWEQLGIRGDILFITGGEKDVLTLAAHGFQAICLNSETANLPRNLLIDLGYRFKHITLLYDVDETGLASMERLTKELKDFQLRSLRLPLNGDKSQKDVSDFFRLGHTPEDLMMLFREMLDHLYKDTMSVMRTCQIDFDNPPASPEPLLTISDVTVGTPGNLVCITGSEGSGKTNFLGGIISGAIHLGNFEIDTLGTQIRENILEQAVLLYDTEQSEFQLFKNLNHILKRCGLQRPPDWFRAYSMVGVSRGERMKLILESMDRFYYENGGIHLVIIDGIADLLAAVNEEESSVRLIEELFRIAAIYNTLIVCVLHMAPSGLKLRGHLGSELQRKAAGILMVEKDDNNGCSLVKALKVRDGSPLDVPIIRFGWSNVEGRHVYLGEMDKEDTKANKLKELQTLAGELFAQKTFIASKDLQRELMLAFGVQERTARSYINTMKEAGIIEKSAQFPGSFSYFGGNSSTN